MKTMPNEVLYHGSPKRFRRLKPKAHYLADHRPVVFATPLREIALASLQPWNDDIFEQGVVGEDPPYMMELRPNAFRDVYGGKRGYLYTLAPDTFYHTDRLTRFEQISDVSPEILDVEIVEDALSALQNSNMQMIYFEDAEAFRMNDYRQNPYSQTDSEGYLINPYSGDTSWWHVTKESDLEFYTSDGRATFLAGHPDVHFDTGEFDSYPHLLEVRVKLKPGCVIFDSHSLFGDVPESIEDALREALADSYGNKVEVVLQYEPGQIPDEVIDFFESMPKSDLLRGKNVDYLLSLWLREYDTMQRFVDSDVNAKAIGSQVAGWFEVERFNDVENIGIYMSDAETYPCSPAEIEVVGRTLRYNGDPDYTAKRDVRRNPGASIACRKYANEIFRHLYRARLMNPGVFSHIVPVMEPFYFAHFTNNEIEIQFEGFLGRADELIDTKRTYGEIVREGHIFAFRLDATSLSEGLQELQDIFDAAEDESQHIFEWSPIGMYGLGLVISKAEMGVEMYHPGDQEMQMIIPIACIDENEMLVVSDFFEQYGLEEW